VGTFYIDWTFLLQMAGVPVEESTTSAPETNVTAEVIVIMTSLGSVRRMHFGSKRAQHILNCKGVVYYVIDINRDVSEGAKLCDQELYESWKREGILLMSDESVYQIPQILIDGVPIGDETMLQDLEEDGDLDWIIARAACPACLNEKDPTDFQCPSCETVLRTLVPEEKVYNGEIQQLFKGKNYGAFGDGGVFEATTPFLTKFKSAGRCDSAAIDTYEDLFGEDPPPGEVIEELP